MGGENWIDSLPYVDTQYAEPGMKERVEQLIKEEMESFRPSKDYIAHLPMPELKFADSPILAAELARVSAGEAMAPMDTTRYQLERPEKADMAAWTRAVDNAKAQLEHQSLRLMNLELLQRYGANTWLEHNKGISQIKERFEQELSRVKDEITAVNRKRKSDQMEVAPKLQLLQNEFYELSHKKIAIQRECENMEQQVKARGGAQNGGAEPMEQ